MPARTRLTELAERKQLLVMQADLHRALLQAECATVRARLSWVRETRDKVRAAGPWLAVAAAGAGLLVAGNWHKCANWIPTGVAAWRWWQSIRRG